MANNLITFLPLGGTQHLVLTLDGDWTVTGGLAPDVNSATVPYTERAKLPANLVYVSGTVYFWGGVDPLSGGEPEHALGNQWLVDCVAVRYGREPGESADTPKLYRLSFADHRSGFCPPRGGRLCEGLGNPEPLGDATLVTCGELIAACLAACGVGASVPSSVDAVEPPRNLEWYTAHAPTELGRLLQHTGHVYCPYSAGGATVQRLGNGTLPTIATSRLISAVSASTVSRLPTCCVVTSGTAAEARTYDDQAGEAPAWEYVVRDPANGYAWRELSTVTALGPDPAAALARDFPAAEERDRKLLRDQLYKVIRLKGDRYDSVQCPVLRSVLYPDGREDTPHLVVTVAVQGQDGAWVNTLTRLDASTVDGAANLLAFDTRLVKVKTGTQTAVLEANCQPLAATAIRPAFTVEDFSGGKRYASVFGFVLGLGVGSMSEGAARSRMTGFYPDTAILDAPECRVIHLNDDTNNRDELASRAEGVAAALLVESPDATTIEVTGFLPCQVDGRINQVRYGQQRYRTTIVRDGWACPSRGGAYPPAGEGGHGGPAFTPSDDPVRQQDRTPAAARARAQATQTRQGGLPARTQAALASPTPPGRTGFRPAVVKVGNTVGGQVGRFAGRTIDGKVKRDASGEYVIGDLGTVATTDDVRLWPAGHKPLPLAKDQVVFALLGPAGDLPATPTPIGLAVPPSPLHLVKVYKDGGAIGSATTASTWTYTVKTTDGVTFKAAVALDRARPVGRREFAPNGSYGLVFYDADTLKLWDVAETETPPLQMVKVYKTGGTVGTQTMASTWTYTVKTPDGVTTIATAVEVAKPRPKGKRDFAADGSFGLLFYDGATARLWDVGEVDDTGACS